MNDETIHNPEAPTTGMTPVESSPVEADAFSVPSAASQTMERVAETPVPPSHARPRIVRQRRGISTGLSGSLQSFASTVVIAVFVITFIVQAFQIPSESMENTLLIGDYLLVDKVHFSGGGPWQPLLPYQPVTRGDIVVFRYPMNPSQHFVKRVVAVPGDRVRLYRKRAWVNG
ncbi:MAG: signal peptidase I, partial [Candidatus Korobacteraceae bacterium]